MMILFVTLDRHKYTLEILLREYRSVIDVPTMVVGYEESEAITSFADSVLILCDLERFDDDSLEVPIALAARARASGAFRILNAPERVLRRVALAERLYQSRINPYRVLRPPIIQTDLRFPVFIRHEREHDGPLTDLLSSAAEVQRELDRLGRQPSGAGLVLVEFVDVRVTDDDAYHKYGAFRVGEAIIPRHLFFSDRWLVKGGRHSRPEHAERERAYIADTEHESLLCRVFELARIDYGRVDYAVGRDGCVVFEVNTNPTVVDRGDLVDEGRRDVTSLFVERFARALRHLAPPR